MSGKGAALTEKPEEYQSAGQPVSPPHFIWSDDKNEEMKQERDISFELVVQAFAADRVLANLPHPNQMGYPQPSLLP